MNLHGIVAPQIAAINPNVPAIIETSVGYTTNVDGSRNPLYKYQNVTAQVQAMTGGDLRQVEALNLSGTKRSIYLYGVANSTVRISAQGGDLVILNDGPNKGVWLVAQVLEQWPDWVKVATTLQLDK